MLLLESKHNSSCWNKLDWIHRDLLPNFLNDEKTEEIAVLQTAED